MGGDTATAVVQVLGRVALTDGDADAALGRGQARELLAYLAARGPTPATTTELVTALWEDDPPPTAATIIHGHVRRLRRALGSASVVHEVGGYRLDLPRDAVDLWRLDDAVRAGDIHRARSLWTEPAFGPFADRRWARDALVARRHLGALGGDDRGAAPAIPAAPLIGRRRELRAVDAALERSRLVTVVGLGGVGKSRLAHEAALRHEDVATVDLGRSTGPAISRIAVDLGLTASEEPGWDLRIVASLVADRPLLLVIDGGEHDLDGAATAIDALLGSCPRLRVLATSRVALGASAEQVVPLLPFDDPGHPYGDAVALLIERMVTLGFADLAVDRTDLATRCARAAGVPLAIELSVTEAVLGRAPRSRPPAEERPDPTLTLDRIVEHTLDGLTATGAAAVHRAARLPHGFTPGLLVGFVDPATSPIGVLYELRATGLIAASSGGHRRRLRLLDPVRRVLLDRPDHGALGAVVGAVAATLATVRPDLTRPIDLAAVPTATAELPNAEALLAQLVDLGRLTDALRLVRSGADVWAEAGSWSRSSAAIEALLAKVRPALAPTAVERSTTETETDALQTEVDPLDWAGGVWARAMAAPTFAAARREYEPLSRAADIVRDHEPGLEAQLRFLLTLGAGYGGDLRLAAAHHARFRALVEVLDAEYGRMMGAQIDALLLLATGDPVGSADALDTVGERAEAIGAIADGARIHRLAALARRLAGDPDLAAAALSRAERLALEAGSVGTLATIRTDIVDLGHQRGTLDRDTVAEALDAVVTVGNLRSAGVLRLRLGVLDDDPAAIAAAALDLFESDRVLAAVALAEVAHRLPRAHPLRAAAPHAAARLREAWGGPPDPVDAARVDRLVGAADPTTVPPLTDDRLRALLHELADPST